MITVYDKLYFENNVMCKQAYEKKESILKIMTFKPGLHTRLQVINFIQRLLKILFEHIF